MAIQIEVSRSFLNTTTIRPQLIQSISFPVHKLYDLTLVASQDNSKHGDGEW
jgi:hypothetical protein